jgi:hypothetical protein
VRLRLIMTVSLLHASTPYARVVELQDDSKGRWMALKPRLQIPSEWTKDRRCFICGMDALHITRVENLPDFVACKNCGSALVLEDDGPRVMYGKIGGGYPQTSNLALRQWANPAMVEQSARAERPEIERPVQPPPNMEGVEREMEEAEEAIPSSAVPIPTEPELDASEDRHVLLRSETPPETPREAIAPTEEPSPGDTPIFTPAGMPEAEVAADVEPTPVEREPDEEETFTPLETDPPPGQRFRVVLKGNRIHFPSDQCAHCMRQPVRGRLAVLGTLPRGQGIGQRRPATFNLPLCAECHKRASQRSEEEKSARLQAYLVATLVALVVLVAVLAWGIIDIADQGLTGAFLLMILAVLGFTVPAWIMLNRLRDFPPPLDSAYVRSTLLVPREPQGLETVFEWRHEAYAERFLEVNEPNAISNVTRVKDRGKAYPT